MPLSASTAHQRFPPPTRQPSMASTSSDRPMGFTSHACLSFLPRTIIFAPIPFKIILYFVFILVGSCLKELNVVPNSYFSSKHNVLNVYFAKLGWGWTIGLLFSFIYLSLLRTYTQRQIFLDHLSRLVIATGFWFTLTHLFVYFESYTGICEHADHQSVTRQDCLKGGFRWLTGYDISGHVFLLTYALLIMNEEVKSYEIHGRKSNDTKTTKPVEPIIINKFISFSCSVFYVLLAMLTIIWEIMILSTSLYFHHTIDKFVAVTIAIAIWALTYRVWYCANTSSYFRPSSPVQYTSE
jgi:hypothetical protein